MDGEGIRTYTKRGKLIKQKKVKKPKGVGPRTIIKKVEVIPKNEIVEPPKRRGRPPNISIVLPPDESPKPKTEKWTILPKKLAGVEITPGFTASLASPGRSPKPGEGELLTSRTERLRTKLGDKFKEAIAKYKTKSKAEKREFLERMAGYKKSGITPEEVNQAKTVAQLDSIHVK